MKNNIKGNRNKSNTEGSKTDCKVSMVTFKILDDDRYSVKNNNLYFNNKSLANGELYDLSEENSEGLSADELVLSYVVGNYFITKFDIRNNNQFEFDMEHLISYIDNWVALGDKYIKLGLKDLENYIQVTAQQEVFKLFEIEQRDGRYFITLDYLNTLF